jgi:hypothetical protein
VLAGFGENDPEAPAGRPVTDMFSNELKLPVRVIVSA